jgi:hypothetical protein
MNLSIALTCEYLWNQWECIEYLTLMNLDHKLYAYTYHCYSLFNITHEKSQIVNTFQIPCTIHKKQIRKLNHAYMIDFLEFTNLMLIRFGQSFNQSICNVPDSVVYLSFDSYFNQAVILPSKLIQLEIHNINYNKQIYLPHTLRYLAWYSRNNLPKIHDNLTHMIIGGILNSEIIYPPKLTHLQWLCGNKLYNIPNTITHLVLNGYINCLGSTSYKFGWSVNYINFDYVRLPASLIYLRVCSDFRGIIQFNNNLKYLKWHYHKEMPKLPDSILCLAINSQYKHKILYIPKQLCKIFAPDTYPHLQDLLNNHNIEYQQYYGFISESGLF